MKASFIISVFIISCLGSFSASAQYGRLERISEWDTLHVVLRTPKETIEKLAKSPDKKNQKMARTISAVEKQLEIMRRNYVLYNQLQTIYVPSFNSRIKELKENGVNVSYYVQEFFFYYPSPRRP